MVNRRRPAAKTAQAQIQAPRSAGGRTGQVHGAVQAWSRAYWQNARYPIGSVQASRPPVTSEHSSPMPVIPVEDAIDSIGPAAKARQIQIGTALQDAQVTGDRVLLERLVSNLLDNAVKHNVTGGWVRASTKTGTGVAEITVSNGGEHIPADQVPGLFEPFRRLSGRTGNQPGTGLGLSIVASVANAHGGHAEAHARPDGGLDVQITLPATANGHRPAAQPRSR
jgi:signal transduction histidine kinase